MTRRCFRRTRTISAISEAPLSYAGCLTRPLAKSLTNDCEMPQRVAMAVCVKPESMSFWITCVQSTWVAFDIGMTIF